MVPFKGRSLEVEQKIKVYRNLRQGGFSVLDAKTGLVVGHADTITIVNAKFNVNEKGRQKVLKEKCKNVHAYISGTYFPNYRVKSEGEEIFYDPYKTAYFIYADSGESVFDATYVICTKNKVFVH